MVLEKSVVLVFNLISSLEASTFENAQVKYAYFKILSSTSTPNQKALE